MRGFLALALAFGLAAASAAAQEVLDLELVLAADGSGSIDDDELALQRRGYAEAITSEEVLGAIAGGSYGAIAVTYVEWGGPASQHQIVDWARIDGPETAAAFAEALVAAPRAAVGYNSISEAIAFGTALIEGNAFEGLRKVIDVSGDGPQIGGRPLSLARAEALAFGITINGLVISRPGGGYRGPRGEPLAEHYQNDVIGGFGAFVETASSRSDLARAIRKKMVLEIAGLESPMEPFPLGLERRRAGEKTLRAQDQQQGQHAVDRDVTVGQVEIAGPQRLQ